VKFKRRKHRHDSKCFRVFLFLQDRSSSLSATVVTVTSPLRVTSHVGLSISRNTNLRLMRLCEMLLVLGRTPPYPLWVVCVVDARPRLGRLLRSSAAWSFLISWRKPCPYLNFLSPRAARRVHDLLAAGTPTKLSGQDAQLCNTMPRTRVRARTLHWRQVCIFPVAGVTLPGSTQPTSLSTSLPSPSELVFDGSTRHDKGRFRLWTRPRGRGEWSHRRAERLMSRHLATR
jgi:hypothetical protein